MKVIKYTLLFSSFFFINIDAQKQAESSAYTTTVCEEVSVFKEKKLYFNPKQLPPKQIQVQPGTQINIHKDHIPKLDPVEGIPYQSIAQVGFKIKHFINFPEKVGLMSKNGRYYKIELYTPQTITLHFWSLKGGEKSSTIIVKEEEHKNSYK